MDADQASDKEPPDLSNKKSYADHLKTNVKYDQRLKRNVLEIVLDITEEKVFINDEHVAKLLKNLGVDIISQVEGVQVKGKFISVWMAKGVNLEKFCKEESIRVTQGVVTGVIRPANRKDVVVTVSGLDYNTPDSFIIDYLNKFGQVIDNNVSYVKYKEGPLEGKYTGERRFRVDFSGANRSMGTFHVIDGARVKVFYRGNKKTCARCHQSSSKCPGGGLAKDCEKNDGPKVHILEHMRNLWKDIDFTPTSFSLNVEEAEDFDVKVTEIPSPTLKNKENQANKYAFEFSSLTIRNFNPSLKDKEIQDFLIESGLPTDYSPNQIKYVRSEKNICVNLEPLEHDVIMNITNNIHFPQCKKKFFDLPLYCRPITGNISPTKEGSAEETLHINSSRSNTTQNVEKSNHQGSPSSVINLIKGYLFSPSKEDSSSDPEVSVEPLSENKNKLTMTPSQLPFNQKLELHQTNEQNANKRVLTSPSTLEPKKIRGSSLKNP